MGQPYFQFKQFTVRHDRCSQRVGTDGVLLGAWADLSSQRRILDVGTGSGLIALMAAQRQPEAMIVGVEIDEDSALQAAENVLQSSFANRIKILHKDIRSYQPSQPFDHILSNPPFHTESTLPPSETRMMARNASVLNFTSLVTCASAMLNKNGLFSVIIPTWSVEEFVSTCLSKGLYLQRRCDVKTTPSKSSKRTLLTFSGCAECNYIHEVLVLADASGNRSDAYRSLTADFYLSD